MLIVSVSASITSRWLWSLSVITELKDFYPCLPFSYLSFVMRRHLFILWGYIECLGFWIARISLYQGSLYWGSVPYILLKPWSGWQILFDIPRTSLYWGSLNWGSTARASLLCSSHTGEYYTSIIFVRDLLHSDSPDSQNLEPVWPSQLVIKKL